MSVLLFGTFDILHKGHQSLFKQARYYGKKIIVCLARDRTIKKVKSYQPVFNEKQRLNNLKKSGWVDRVILGDKVDYYKIIKKVQPQKICLGYDQKIFVAELKRKIKSFGLKIKIIRLKSFYPKIYKSSKIREKIYA